MSKNHRLIPNDLNCDFLGNERKEGRIISTTESFRGVHLSSFYRALAIFILIGTLPFSIFLVLRDRLSHVWLWCSMTLIVLFIALWYFTYRSMKHSGYSEVGKAEKPQRKNRLH
jgi:hypothetical protein